MNRKDKIVFLKQFQKFGIINKPEKLPPLRIWTCKADSYTLEGTERIITENEMREYLKKEGRLFSNIIVFLDGPPFCSSEDEIDLTEYKGSYHTVKALI